MSNNNIAEKLLTPEEIRIKQFYSDIKEIVEMQTGAGKRVLREIIARGGIFRTTYTGNAQTNYLEGRRSIALEIVAALIQSVSVKEQSEILLTDLLEV